MAVLFHIPGPLRQFAGGLAQVEVGGSPTTVGEALRGLWARYPGLRDRLVTEQGEVRQHVNIFVGNESIRWAGGLFAAVSDGSEISIVPAVSGGSSRHKVD